MSGSAQTIATFQYKQISSAVNKVVIICCRYKFFYTIHRVRHLPFIKLIDLDFKIGLFDDVFNVGGTAITQFQSIKIKNLMVFTALGEAFGEPW